MTYSQLYVIIACCIHRLLYSSLAVFIACCIHSLIHFKIIFRKNDTLLKLKHISSSNMRLILVFIQYLYQFWPIKYPLSWTKYQFCEKVFSTRKLFMTSKMLGLNFKMLFFVYLMLPWLFYTTLLANILLFDLSLEYIWDLSQQLRSSLWPNESWIVRDIDPLFCKKHHRAQRPDIEILFRIFFTRGAKSAFN